LAAQADALGRDAGRHRTAHLIAGRGIDVQTKSVKSLQHGCVGQRLHRKADGEAIRIREVERSGRLLFECRLVINVGRSAKAGRNLSTLLLGEEAESLDRDWCRRTGGKPSSARVAGGRCDEAEGGRRQQERKHRT